MREEKGVDYAWVDLREKPPSRARIRRWLKAFGHGPMRNTSGGSYRALGPEKKDWGAKEWEAAFVEDAMLLKRPVLEIDGQPAAVGFRPDAWANLL
jgi:arsenate reductase